MTTLIQRWNFREARLLACQGVDVIHAAAEAFRESESRRPNSLATPKADRED